MQTQVDFCVRIHGKRISPRHTLVIRIQRSLEKKHSVPIHRQAGWEAWGGERMKDGFSFSDPPMRPTMILTSLVPIPNRHAHSNKAIYPRNAAQAFDAQRSDDAACILAQSFWQESTPTSPTAFLDINCYKGQLDQTSRAGNDISHCDEVQRTETTSVLQLNSLVAASSFPSMMSLQRFAFVMFLSSKLSTSPG